MPNTREIVPFRLLLFCQSPATVLILRYCLMNTAVTRKRFLLLQLSDLGRDLCGNRIPLFLDLGRGVFEDLYLLCDSCLMMLDALGKLRIIGDLLPDLRGEGTEGEENRARIAV